MTKNGRSVGCQLLGAAFLAAAFSGLSARSAAASEFEIVADSFTVDNQINLSSVSYFNARGTAPTTPTTATSGMTTPGGMYFDGLSYRVWDNNASVWVALATGTISASALSGSGTAGYVPLWGTGGEVLGNSSIQDDGSGHVSMGSSGGTTLAIGGTGVVAFNNNAMIHFNNGNNQAVFGADGNTAFTNQGNTSFENAGSGAYVDVLGMTVTKDATTHNTTLYSGNGTGGKKIAIIK